MRRLSLLLAAVALACDAPAALDPVQVGTGGAVSGGAAIGGGAGTSGTPSGGAGAGLGGALGGAVAGGAAGAVGSVGGAGAAGESGASAGGGGSGGVGSALPAKSGILCVFDYDLTISTNACALPQSWCRKNTCRTYSWYEQCVSDEARRAIALCVERGAFIGIASHAWVDGCWTDKVLPIVEQMQFPELTSAARYAAIGFDFAYPQVDDRDNWNCDDCAYHMDPSSTKPQLIAKVMRHYQMDPNDGAARARVIFWDDTRGNITATERDMPEVTTVQVALNVDGDSDSGGCGIRADDIEAGWAPFGF